MAEEVPLPGSESSEEANVPGARPEGPATPRSAGARSAAWISCFSTSGLHGL